MTKQKEINLGKYRHFKGGLYEVLGLATDSETLKDVVVYKSLSDNTTWVRPLKMFEEKVEKSGEKVPRFEYIGE